MVVSPDSNSRKTALVTGVTGPQGSAVAHHLIEIGWRVRGLTRNIRSKSARRITHDGIELVSGDLEDRARLVEMMRTVDGVFGVTPMDPRGYSAQREIRQGTTIAEAAKEASVPLLVFSTVSATRGRTGVPHVDVKREIEEVIQGLGIPATIIRPNVFMDNLVSDIAKVYWHLAPKLVGWDKPLPWIATNDIGAVVARALAEPDRWIGHTLELMGDRRTFREAIGLYRDAFGRRPRTVPIPVSAFRRLVGEELVVMWEWQGTEEFGVHSDELADMPIRFTKLDEFLRRSAHARSAGIVTGSEVSTG